MPNVFLQFGATYIGGLLTPLTAVCVLPLYPAFLSFISTQLSGKQDRKTFALVGAIASAGVLLFMLLLGLIFTTLFQTSLTKVIGIISPIAFGILGIIGIALLFNVDFTKFMPKAHAPMSKNPYKNSFFFGFFFGAIVIPCNPALLAVLFARAASTTDFASQILNFLVFGLGLSTPLLVFALFSAGKSSAIIGWLTSRQKTINRAIGVIMVLVSSYYLLCVFKVFGTGELATTICKPFTSAVLKFESAGSWVQARQSMSLFVVAAIFYVVLNYFMLKNLYRSNRSHNSKIVWTIVNLTGIGVIIYYFNTWRSESQPQQEPSQTVSAIDTSMPDETEIHTEKPTPEVVETVPEVKPEVQSTTPQPISKTQKKTKKAHKTKKKSKTQR